MKDPVNNFEIPQEWIKRATLPEDELIQQAERVVLTTGRLGMRYSNMLFPDHTVVMVGNRISEGLDAAKDKSEVVICGLLGLILMYCADQAVSRPRN